MSKSGSTGPDNPLHAFTPAEKTALTEAETAARTAWDEFKAAKDALGHEGGKGREGERERVDELEARAREKETVLKGLQDFSGCCSVLSVIGVILLTCFGLAFDANVEVLMGSVDSPKDGAAVARNCYAAAVVYACFIAFCGCQIGLNKRYARGAVRI